MITPLKSWQKKLVQLLSRPLRYFGDKSRDQKAWNRSAKFYKAYLDLNPDDAPIWVQYGNSLKELGKYSLAGQVYDRALELDASNSNTRVMRNHIENAAAQSQAKNIARRNFLF
ncbi:MAG: hypothetical protein KGJ29_15265, partial [Hyphomicrobiales bacterium]|nr:hypothetical protein [Hyphomicrobiales bacterium]